MKNWLNQAGVFLAMIFMAFSADARRSVCEPPFYKPLALTNAATLGLKRAGTYWAGYEVMRASPLFRNPERLRRFLNDVADERFVGSARIDRGILSVIIQNKRNRPPAIEQILDEIGRFLPEPYLSELEPYIASIMKDAELRGHNYNNFSFSIRTELTSLFPNGHTHKPVIDLNYARAVIGQNTEIDQLGREQPERPNYVSFDGANSVTVFGTAWHRTPPINLAAGEKRLYILAELTLVDLEKPKFFRR